ncbi:MAG: hypothetical protein NTV39_02725 [Candidatus Saccharibacteria bacterium]|nr:hypothetical protein [Candidatus Saccharibacteria bacterium]
MIKPRTILTIVSLVVITIIFGTMYISQQQLLRISANSPQIQLAQDTAAELNSGTSPASLTKNRIDIGNSLAPFVIIYSRSGQLVSGNGYLNGKIPTVPIGVLQHSNGKDYSFVTWQPQDNVRIASVSVSANNYYVLAGRSLKEVEKQENSQLQFAMFGWIVSVVVIIFGNFVGKFFRFKTPKK